MCSFGLLSAADPTFGTIWAEDGTIRAAGFKAYIGNLGLFTCIKQVNKTELETFKCCVCKYICMCI